MGFNYEVYFDILRELEIVKLIFQTLFQIAWIASGSKGMQFIHLECNFLTCPDKPLLCANFLSQNLH